ncbi:MAG: BMP family ABC transporter substrate-binding protein [Bdellovibrionales bacterium]|nr:BMP family ABC transporter substrate-binding protein [Bdellovibrionales bacterium]
MGVVLAGAAVSSPSGATPAALAAPFRAALVLDKGGRDDKSFNAAAYEGMLRAERELGIQFKYVEGADDAAIENTMRAFAQKKFDLVVGVGFVQQEAVKKNAAAFPGVKFALVDAEVGAPNVRSLLFQEHEGSFLMGAVAAHASKTGRVGFVGGMDVPLIRRFQRGYEAGARHVSPSIKVISNYVGVTGDAWNNPPKAKELALGQYQQGVDVIFAAAGASNNGVFDAAEDKRLFAIGVDSNQNWVKPGRILTSMLKRVDLAVFQAVKDAQGGKFTPGVQRFGLKDGGVDYSLDQHNKAIFPPELKARVDRLKADIVRGKIVVPDYYKTKR